MKAALLLGLAACAGLTTTGVAWAESEPVAAVVDGGVGQKAVGRMAVNQTSGVGNAQANLAAISNNDANVTSSQRIAYPLTAVSATSRLSGQAFNGAAGLVSINQSSGVANGQVNVAVIAPAASVSQVSQARLDQGSQIEQLGDSALSAVAAHERRPGTSPTPQGTQDASIASTALRNTSGVVQVNQTAGTGNVTSNVFVLRPPAGTLF